MLWALCTATLSESLQSTQFTSTHTVEHCSDYIQRRLFYPEAQSQLEEDDAQHFVNCAIENPQLAREYLYEINRSKCLSYLDPSFHEVMGIFYDQFDSYDIDDDTLLPSDIAFGKYCEAKAVLGELDALLGAFTRSNKQESYYLLHQITSTINTETLVGQKVHEWVKKSKVYTHPHFIAASFEENKCSLSEEFQEAYLTYPLAYVLGQSNNCLDEVKNAMRTNHSQIDVCPLMFGEPSKAKELLTLPLDDYDSPLEYYYERMIMCDTTMPTKFVQEVFLRKQGTAGSSQTDAMSWKAIVRSRISGLKGRPRPAVNLNFDKVPTVVQSWLFGNKRLKINAEKYRSLVRKTRVKEFIEYLQSKYDLSTEERAFDALEAFGQQHKLILNGMTWFHFSRSVIVRDLLLGWKRQKQVEVNF